MIEYPEVEPCPYCGNLSMEVRKNDDREKYVYCPECGARGGCEEGYEEDYVSHIEKWNRRDVAKFPLADMKSCPFCGNTEPKLIRTYGDMFHVFCPSCLVNTSDETNPETAIRNWNKRVSKADVAVIKTCPVCGSSAKPFKAPSGHWVVMCQEETCGLSIPARNSEAEAIVCWNERVKEIEKGEKFKPCPICGGSVVLVPDGGCWRIVCPKCHCKTESHSKTSELVERWNFIPSHANRGPAVKRCPICGAPGRYWMQSAQHYVGCEDVECGFQINGQDTMEEAVNLWNGEVKNG